MSLNVRAGGGVLWRRGPEGPEVAVVHRPKYDDWSLPKGKCDRGEDERAAAEREVWEETGYTVSMGPEVGSTRYLSLKGPKIVRYWAMEVTGGEFQANSEVDELRWLPLDEAADLLSYGRDREILRRAEGALG